VFTYAGTKDKRAITCQYITAHRLSAERVKAFVDAEVRSHSQLCAALSAFLCFSPSYAVILDSNAVFLQVQQGFTNLRVGNFSYVKNSLRLGAAHITLSTLPPRFAQCLLASSMLLVLAGDLSGNRFTIVLRYVDVDEKVAECYDRFETRRSPKGSFLWCCSCCRLQALRSMTSASAASSTSMACRFAIVPTIKRSAFMI
jgi:hypothetical protein